MVFGVCLVALSAAMKEKKNAMFMYTPLKEELAICPIVYCLSLFDLQEWGWDGREAWERYPELVDRINHPGT